MAINTDAYLDIETTGFSPGFDRITVIGIYLVNGKNAKVIQLVGDEICPENLIQALTSVGSIYTYNGSRFDLPFIRRSIGVDLKEMFDHHDLMYDCWRNNLKGGLKVVERILGIGREVEEVDGMMAVRLWWRYVNYGDDEALDLLLRYNVEDVVNLEKLRTILCRKYYFTGNR